MSRRLSSSHDRLRSAHVPFTAGPHVLPLARPVFTVSIIGPPPITTELQSLTGIVGPLILLSSDFRCVPVRGFVAAFHPTLCSSLLLGPAFPRDACVFPAVFFVTLFRFVCAFGVAYALACLPVLMAGILCLRLSPFLFWLSTNFFFPFFCLFFSAPLWHLSSSPLPTLVFARDPHSRPLLLILSAYIPCRPSSGLHSLFCFIYRLAMLGLV